MVFILYKCSKMSGVKRKNQGPSFGVFLPTAAGAGADILFWPPAGYRTVDALLQRMFEAEIPLEDEGPSLEETPNLSPVPSAQAGERPG